MICSRAFLIGVLWATPALASLDSPPQPVDLSNLATKAQVPTLAPVQSVNGLTGPVQLPLLQRQASGQQDITSGTMTWTYPVAYASAPSCVVSVVSGSTSYVFSQATFSSLTPTAVTANIRAANVSLLTLGVVWGPPPSGSTMSITCNGFYP